MRRRLKLPRSQWPAEEAARFDALFHSGEDLFENAGPACHLRPATRAGLADCYGRWLGFLRAHNISVNGSPAEAATPETVRAYAEDLLSTWSAQSASDELARLQQIINWMAPHADFCWLGDLARRLRRSHMRKSKAPLGVTSFDLWRGAEAALGEVWVALESDRPRLSVLCAYRDLLMIALLAFAPLRSKNLVALTLGRSLQCHAGRWMIICQAAETKNGEPLVIEWPEALRLWLERYVDRVRPLLIGSGNTSWLWPTQRNGHVDGVNFCKIFAQFTQSRLGTRLTPHRARDVAANTWVLHASDQVREISHLLGHRDPTVADRHYKRAASLQASRKFQQVIDRLRKTPPAGASDLDQRTQAVTARPPPRRRRSSPRLSSE